MYFFTYVVIDIPQVRNNLVFIVFFYLYLFTYVVFDINQGGNNIIKRFASPLVLTAAAPKFCPPRVGVVRLRLALVRLDQYTQTDRPTHTHKLF